MEGGGEGWRVRVEEKGGELAGGEETRVRDELGGLEYRRKVRVRVREEQNTGGGENVVDQDSTA